MGNNSNILVKTIIFILVVALSCLIFFGLDNEDKTDMQLVAFGFIMFAELLVYITLLIGNLKSFKKLDSSDVISWGALYFLTNIITNCAFFSSMGSIRTIIVINSIEFIIFLIILCVIMLKKKK